MYRDFQSNPFLITCNPLEKSNGHFERHMNFSNAHLYYDEKTELEILSSVSFSAAIIGYVLDITDGKKSAKDILNEIRERHEVSFEAMLDYLDFLNGRFILITDDGKDTMTFTDATSMRPVFYWENRIFGSHEVLVKEIVQIESRIALPSNPKMNGYMDYSNTKGILKFNPNMYFSFANLKFRRYHPRKKFEPISIDEAVEKSLECFKQQQIWLEQNYSKFYFSLTGGLDSKVSLSLIKSLKEKTHFFTYMIDLDNAKAGEKKNIYALDKKLVEEIVYNLDLDHELYYLKDYRPTEEYRKKLLPNISSHHSIPASYLTYRKFKDDAIHIKSTIYEMAKLPFPVETDSTKDPDSLYAYGKRWEPKVYRNKRTIGRRMFDDFMERTDFYEVGELAHNMPLFLYWETRMANWHSNITQETDNALETFIFLNSRYLLDMITRLGVEDRQQKRYLSRIIDHFWPILNYHVPNSRRNLKDIVEEGKEPGHEREFALNGINNIDMEFDGTDIVLKPAKGVKTKDDDISFVIENKKEVETSVLLKGFYSHPKKNIFVRIENESHSINDFKEGKRMILKPRQQLKIRYEYARNFLNDSWYDAGRLKILEQ